MAKRWRAVLSDEKEPNMEKFYERLSSFLGFLGAIIIACMILVLQYRSEFDVTTTPLRLGYFPLLIALMAIGSVCSVLGAFASVVYSLTRAENPRFHKISILILDASVAMVMYIIPFLLLPFFNGILSVFLFIGESAVLFPLIFMSYPKSR
jgi:hypothetical protein